MANMRLQGWWPDQGQRYRHVCLVVLLLWSVVSFAWTGSVQAKADGPAPLHQLAKTLEGEKTPPSSLLFYRRPLGFDLYTFETLLTPARAPADFLAALTAVVEEERQKLGGAGALFLEGFALVTLAGLSVRRRVTAGALARGATLEARCPVSYRPLLAAGLRVAVATLSPLSLLLLFLLGQAFGQQEEPVLSFVVQLLTLWTAVAGLICLVREVLLGPLVPAPHGAALFRLVRLLVLYIAGGLAVLWGGTVLHIPRDVLALVRFLLVLTVGASVFLLWSLDEAILALLPLLPNRLYRRFLEAVERAYHPILFLTFTIGLLWGVGYHNLAGFLLQRS